ncbi:MAG: hypothetical protein AB1546_00040 [bacterium]
MKIKLLLITTIVFFLSPPNSTYGMLSFLSNDGTKLFNPTLFNHSENTFDLSSPISLLDDYKRDKAPSPALAFSSTAEDIYSLKKNGVLITNLSAKEKKVFFLYPLSGSPHSQNEKNGRFSIIGLDIYSSKLNFYNRDEDEITSLNFRGDGNTISYALKKGNFHSGIYQNFSSIKGIGIVPELNAKTALLTPDAETTITLKEKKYGWSVGYKFQDKYLLSFQKNKTVVPLNITVQDADDVFYFPVKSRGSSHQTALSFPFSNRDKISTFYSSGDNTALDINRFHISQPADTAEFANTLRLADYESFGIGWIREITKRSTLRFEFKKYSAEFRGAGDISPGLSAFIPHYFYEHRGDISLKSFKIHYLRRKKKISFSTSYTMAPFDANLYLFICQKTFFGGCKTPPDYEENYIFRSSKIHTLSLGVSAGLGHGKNLIYSITQIVPQINRIKAAVPAPPGPPAPPEVKKEKGGRIHHLMLEFRF